MSEEKRISLTSIGPKTAKKPVKEAKSIRLNFTLSEPNKKWCPVFDYERLIKAEKGKTATQNGDDDDTRGLVKQLEEKYGKTERRYTYAELGAGYDESDSFIDNTEICEEQLVDDTFKKYEGYYINREKFEDTKVETKKRKRRVRIVETEDSETSSSVTGQPPAKKTVVPNGNSVASSSGASSSSDSSPAVSMDGVPDT